MTRTIFGAIFVTAALGLAGNATLAENRIDGQRPQAPELAAYGDLPIGVRTLDLVNPDRINVLAIDPAVGGPSPEDGVNLAFGAPHGVLALHQSGSDSYVFLPDPRIKTILSFGIWAAIGTSGAPKPSPRSKSPPSSSQDPRATSQGMTTASA